MQINISNTGLCSCPKCGSENISADLFNGEYASQVVVCNSCDIEWVEYFKCDSVVIDGNEYFRQNGIKIMDDLFLVEPQTEQPDGQVMPVDPQNAEFFATYFLAEQPDGCFCREWLADFDNEGDAQRFIQRIKRIVSLLNIK